MSKKWYNYFISLESEEAQKESAKEEMDAPPSSPEPPHQVSELIEHEPEPHIAQPIETEGGEPVDFHAIYDAVGIKSPAGNFDVYKVEQMLNSDHLKEMTRSVKKNAVLVAVEAAGVSIDDVVKDAVQRDRALDAYETVEEKSVQQLEKQKSEENMAIQEEIDRFLQEKRAIIEANNQAVRNAKERFRDWQLRKQEEEQRIFDVVNYFLSPNPITTSTHPGAADTDDVSDADGADNLPDDES